MENPEPEKKGPLQGRNRRGKRPNAERMGKIGNGDRSRKKIAKIECNYPQFSFMPEYL